MMSMPVPVIKVEKDQFEMSPLPPDFAIDFNDGGLVGDPNDGTDWGESRGARRCGVSNLATGQWFIFVRERD